MIAGVLLLTVPAPTKNINHINAATEEIDGQEYAVFAVYGTTTVDEIRTFYTEHAKVKFVLQEDWVYKPATATNGDAGLWSRNNSLLGGWVVLDLNGYTIDCAMPEAVSKGFGVGILAEYLQIWDSSPAGTGCVKGSMYVYNRTLGNCHLSIYGGTIDKIIVNLNSPWAAVPEFTCEIYGGSIGYLASYPNALSAPISDLTKVVINGGYVGGVDPEITDVTSVIDNVEYQTIYLMGDSDPEQTMTIFNGESTKNYRYIFVDDWDMVAHQVGTGSKDYVRGNNIIIDLNGHQVNSNSSAAGGYFLQLSGGVATIEFTDSSATGGGSINVTSVTSANTVIISGNGDYVIGYGVKQLNVIIRGGKSVQLQCWGEGGIAANLGSLTLAPYMQFTRETGAGTATNRRYYAPTHEAYAVSASTIVAGSNNYEYGYLWDLPVGDLWNLAVPNDKTYYLWGRKADGAYEYLNIEYRDGAWVTAK